LETDPAEDGPGVLLVNLGTPDAPTTRALRRYLREFLTDPRVIGLPRTAWRILLESLILPLRSPRSARRYQSIWLDRGSPLLVHSEDLRGKLAQRLHAGGRDHPRPVALAMRYGSPSIAKALKKLHRCRSLVVVPLYPQYSAATTASAFDGLARALTKIPRIPEIRFISGYSGEAVYLDAVTQTIRRIWGSQGEPDFLLFSFHGLPLESVRRGDPYYFQCLATAETVATRLALDPNRWSVSFQSRFGRAQWLPPYTVDRVRELAGLGTRSLDVICPGFACDCLETLEEIAIENAQAFREAGGGHFRYLPALNADTEHVEALAALIERELSAQP
jgi:ferrochelatase